MKTVFSILIVCIFAADAVAIVPQAFADQYEYAVVESPIVESPIVESPIVESTVIEAPVVESHVTPSASCGCTGSRGITLRDMWDREHPDGTQHGHVAYPSNGMYYYRRPYNASHYRQHRMRLQQSFEATEQIEPRFHDGFQYVNPKEQHLFRSQIRSADPVRDRVDPPTESGVLEFADWQRYKAANLAWSKELEAKSLEERTPAQLSSHAK